MGTVTLKVDTLKLLNNLKNAFAGKGSVVDEMLQNGRRAGASRIDVGIEDDGDTVSFTDDGHGIDDFQKLLTIGEAGWQNQSVSEENPYGMGFLSALFAAKTVVVSSKCGTMMLDTGEFLKTGEAVSINGSQTSPLTKVSLIGVDIAKSGNDFRNLMDRAAAGFPVAVFLDGEELDRPDSPENGFEPLPGIGTARVTALTGRYPECAIYLQGKKVHPEREYHCAHAVHLDPSLFPGRMPDRDRLVDHDERVKEIVEAVKARQKDLFLGEMEKADDKDAFITQNRDAIEYLDVRMEAVSASGIVPACLLYTVHELPDNRIYQYPETCSAGPYSEKDIVSRGIRFVVEPDGPEEMSDTETVLTWAYLCAREDVVIIDQGYRHWFPEDHFVHAHILDTGDSGDWTPVTAKPEGDVKTGIQVHGHEIFADSVVTCDTVVYDGPFGPVSTSTTPCVMKTGDGDNEKTVIVLPADCGTYELIRHCSSYANQYDDYMERDYDEDCDLLDSVERATRADGPAAILRAALRTHHIGYDMKAAGNTAFTVSFNEHGDIKVEPIDSGASMTITTGEDGLHVATMG